MGLGGGVQKRSHVSHCVKLSRVAPWDLLRQAAHPDERLQQSPFPWWEKAPLLCTVSWVFAQLAALSILSGFIGSALWFARAAGPAMALSPARAQAAWLNRVLFIPPRNVQASKDLRELTEQHVLLRAGGVTVGSGGSEGWRERSGHAGVLAVSYP